MSGPAQDERGQVLEPLLDYGCSHWRTSSQRAADLYDSGVKLWRKEDLVDIERQLARSCTAEKFTVRRIDGSIVHIKNPMFGVQKPIWRPYVKFQEFWHLVRSTPDGPPQTYHCTYLVDWTNQTVRNYEGPIENVRLLFKTSQQRWGASATCEALKSQLRKLLGGDGNAKKVTKIVCFGLGDMNRKPPDWWRIENNTNPEDEREPETSVVEGAFVHHAIALTMADVARSCAKGDAGARLLTQDPDYSDETKDILQNIGFEVVGEYGAGGFAELDDESVVISAFTASPVKQIIADLARPVAIICAGRTSDGVFNKFQYLIPLPLPWFQLMCAPPRKPYADPESPRTRQMWKGYESRKFPVQSEDGKMEGSLHQLEIYARIGE
ncbi:hypothetical protein F4781DRAFT_397279 [Annulohypoxylon bovei var. microspora]|nr:hypothetical protein F4781DRAFT_397279 [Annulohypoxylon bovei var. microspora]